MANLPSGYQEVEYIESTYGQNQRISTGYFANSNMRFISEFMWRGSNSSDDVMYGTTDGTRRRGNPLCFLGSGTDLNFGAQNGANFGAIAARNVKHTFDYNVSRGILDGTTYTYNSGNSGNLEITLFYGNGRGSNGRLYSFKIYTGETLERDFVPCYRKSDDEIGMYDTVNDTFYTNTGSGTFAKGPDVIKPLINHGVISTWHKATDTSGEYEPGSNTIAYYKFENNLNDSSGNDRNLTVRSGTFTYGTTGNKSYVVLDRNNWTNYIDLPFSNQAYTSHVWIKGYQTTSNSRGIVVEMWGNGPRRLQGGQGSHKLNLNGVTYDDDNWHLWTCVSNGGTAYYYIDGVLNSSSSISSVSSVRFLLNNAGDTNSSTYAGYAYVSDIIHENKVWSANEILDYYATTKIDYNGLMTIAELKAIPISTTLWGDVDMSGLYNALNKYPKDYYISFVNSGDIATYDGKTTVFGENGVEYAYEVVGKYIVRYYVYYDPISCLWKQASRTIS